MMQTMQVTLNVVVGPERVQAMDEQEFKQYLVKLLREAINEQDAVIIQPASYQGLVLSERHDD